MPATFSYILRIYGTFGQSLRTNLHDCAGLFVYLSFETFQILKYVKNTLKLLWRFCAAAALTACKSSMKIKHLPYPEAERTEVVDNYFGTEVADPTAGSKTTVRNRLGRLGRCRKCRDAELPGSNSVPRGDACPPDRAVGLSPGRSSG